MAVDLSSTVAIIAVAFNDLPRRPLQLNGLLPNHWIISCYSVNVPTPTDIFIFHCVGGRHQFLIRAQQPVGHLNDRERAQAMVPTLLAAIGKKCNEGELDGVPWSWSCATASAARELEVELKRVGVRDDLCVVRVNTAEESEEAMTLFQLKWRLMMAEAREGN